MRDLDNPIIEQIERTGYPFTRQPIAYRCKCCKLPIYDGDEYVEDDLTGDTYCDECFRERFRHKTA